MNWKSFFEFLKNLDQHIANYFENNLARLIVSVTPYTASFPPAAFLYANLTEIVRMDWPIALIISIAVEGIGVSSVSTFFKAKRHNLDYPSEQNRVALWPSFIAYIVYLIAVISTNVIIEIPTIGTETRAEDIALIVAKAALSLIAISGAFIISTNFSISSIREKYTKSESEKIKDLRDKLSNSQKESKRTAQALAKSEAELSRLQVEAEGIQALKEELSALQAARKEELSNLAQVKEELSALQAKTSDMQAGAKAFQAMNKKSQAAAMYLAGSFPTLQEAASAAGVHESTISRVANNLNGSK